MLEGDKGEEDDQAYSIFESETETETTETEVRSDDDCRCYFKKYTSLFDESGSYYLCFAH